MSQISRPYPLALTSEGQRVKIVSLRAGRGLERRLLSMGLTVGSVVEVIARQPGGAIVVGYQDTRIALGAGMAHKIAVMSCEDT
jgi:ferrous iron transport protein A